MISASRDYPDRPLLGVSVVARRNGRVLLVRRGRPPLEGLWSFPGGLVEIGETVRGAAAREVLEETGIEIEIGEQIETVEIIHRDEAGKVDRHYVLHVFSGVWRAGQIAAGDDAAEAVWADPAELAQFTMTPDTERILARLCAA